MSLSLTLLSSSCGTRAPCGVGPGVGLPAAADTDRVLFGVRAAWQWRACPLPLTRDSVVAGRPVTQ
jgi:hypothetical protein